MTETTALLTDRYELTMVDASLRDGTGERRCVFEVFTRHLANGRRYGVLAGTGRLLQAIRDFRFGDAELAWLATEGVVSPATLDWLADYRFRGTIHGYPEGEAFFPGSPVLVVEAGFAEGVLLETIALSVLNHDSAVATAASRMVGAAQGRPVTEMGSRRAEEHAAVAAARAAFIAGFAASSNLEAGRLWGIPTMGTAAHAFTLVHDSERDAFRSQLDALGAGTTLLVDTYDIESGIRNAVELAGTGLGSIRIDSGDLRVVVSEARRLLDELGARATRIIVTNDLDEHAVAALAATPVDSYGVGTSVVTGSGTPTMGMVYKLVARQEEDGTWLPVAKTSSGKASIGGRKNVTRRLAGGRAVAEIVHLGEAASAVDVPGDEDRPVLVPLVVDGTIDERWLGPGGVLLARERHAATMQELPLRALQLSAGDPVLPTVFEG